MLNGRLDALRLISPLSCVAVHQKVQRLAQDFAGGPVATRRDLVPNVADERFSEGDVEGVLGSHGGPYQITCEGVTLSRLRLKSMAP